MKAVLVTSYMKSKGGVSRFVYEFAEYLVSQNDQVTIISLYTDKNIFASKDNIKIIDISDEKCLPQTIRFWFNLKKIQKNFAREIIQENPDVILFNDFPSTMWAQKFQNIPVLCYTHDIHMLYTNTYINNLKLSIKLIWKILRIIFRFYDKKKWRCFDEIFCNSNFLSQYILKTYKIKTKVIYPGTDTSKFTNFGVVVKEKTILTLGDIKLRRADFLLDIAKQMYEKRDDFKIWIVGNKGSYDNELKEKVKKNNLENKVELFGQVSDVRLAELYSKALVTVHLVKEAPFGLIVTEAMACGSPVISWIPGGPAEIIEDEKNGFLIEENDPKQLIDKIELFLNNPELSITMGKNAQSRIREYFESSKKFSELRERMVYWSTKVSNG